MRLTMTMGALALLAGCGGEAEAPKPAAEKARELSGGEYEVTETVTSFRTTDKSGKAPAIKVGDKTVRKVCAKPGAKPDLALHAVAGDSCTDMSSFVSRGRLSLQYNCKRPGQGGYVSVLADGSFTADSFETSGNIATAFTGEGDYVVGRTVAGKRLGDCPAA